MLINVKDSCLLLIDVQEKLIPAIFQHEQITTNCAWLLDVAHELQIPVLWSEQYPQGLGETIPALKTRLPGTAMVKQHFSCAADEICLTQIMSAGKSQILLMGIEAHVCVLSTAIELKQQGLEVFVIIDAVSARHVNDIEIAKIRLQQEGITLVTKEMVFFEWLRCAGSEKFKQLSKKFF